MNPKNIGAPDQVEEGQSAPIEIAAPGASEIRVTILATGQVFDVKVGDDGHARFELPHGATAGTTVVVTDRHNLEDGAIITVVPASE